MTELVSERLLYPQSSIKNNYNYWQSLHKQLQKLLTIHKEQGNKTSVFPFDLAYLITNRWNPDEKNSYKVTYEFSDFNSDESLKKMIEKNLTKIKSVREKIHNRLQYLLDKHVDDTKPFPLDLVYMLDLDTFYFYEALKYDKEYDYDRDYPKPYYNGPVFYMSGLLNESKSELQYRFFDVEDTDTNMNELKYYVMTNNIPDSVPEDYLLWKAADNDKYYNYNRNYCASYSDPDNYLPDEEEFVFNEYEYENLNNDYEPDYNSFNHFKDIETYDEFYANVEA